MWYAGVVWYAENFNDIYGLQVDMIAKTFPCFSEE